MLFLKEVIDALCNGYGPEIVQGNDQLQIAAGTGDTGITDHAVETFGMQLVQLVYCSLSSLRRGQVHTDVAALQINVDDFVSFLKQQFFCLGADSAGCAGDCIYAHDSITSLIALFLFVAFAL